MTNNLKCLALAILDGATDQNISVIPTIDPKVLLLQVRYPNELYTILLKYDTDHNEQYREHTSGEYWKEVISKETTIWSHNPVKVIDVICAEKLC
jgi:hypothetical protein